MSRYGYYPGCCLSSSAKEYDASIRAVCAALGIELIELSDWNCCGGSSIHSLSTEVDLALSARNIAIAQRQELDMVMPCACCYSRTARGWQALRDDPEKRKILEAELGVELRKDLQLYHLLQLIDQELANWDGSPGCSRGVDPAQVDRVVCYYGCLITRPRGINPHENVEYPEAMGRILTRMGYQPLRWSFATECCAASLSLTRGDVVHDRVDRIVAAAQETGADAIVTACPLCHINLESRQSGRFRVFYFTELVGVALGLPESQKWWRLHLVNPMEGLPKGA